MFLAGSYVSIYIYIINKCDLGRAGERPDGGRYAGQDLVPVVPAGAPREAIPRVILPPLGLSIWDQLVALPSSAYIAVPRPPRRRRAQTLRYRRVDGLQGLPSLFFSLSCCPAPFSYCLILSSAWAPPVPFFCLARSFIIDADDEAVFRAAGRWLAGRILADR